MNLRPNGGIRWQVGRTIDLMRDCVIAGDVGRVADLTRFLIMISSPVISRADREKLVMPKRTTDRDRDGSDKARVMEECLDISERVLLLLKGRSIYAEKDLEDGGDLSDIDYQGPPDDEGEAA